MLSHAFRLVDTPMWTGFNSKIMIDDSPQQLISYLTPIKESPTSNAVVLATMQQCMSVLQELSQEKDFQKDFGIKRTNKPFSRQPIDLTLEQTINADAARTLTGIAHLTNSISARQRWASHDIRSTIITHVLEEIGITKKQDISTELQPHNIKKSCHQLEKFMNSFDQYVNPFSLDL
ncbi:uncharacterized protein TNCV_1315941 [Trichonephila clavipes]|nr:uncharacterized protein TNCV_1315941 [Trichonephila clavipes]